MCRQILVRPRSEAKPLKSRHGPTFRLQAGLEGQGHHHPAPWPNRVLLLKGQMDADMPRRDGRRTDVIEDDVLIRVFVFPVLLDAQFQPAALAPEVGVRQTAGVVPVQNPARVRRMAQLLRCLGQQIVGDGTATPLPFDSLSFSSIIGLPLDWLTFSNASTISKSYSPLGQSLLSAISFSVLGWKFIVVILFS